MSGTHRVLVVTAASAVTGSLIAVYPVILNRLDPSVRLFRENCSACHGERLEGAAQGPRLVGGYLTHGESVSEISRSIASGFPEQGMPASHTLTDVQIQGLAMLIFAARTNFKYSDLNADSQLVIPEDTIKSEQHDFRIEIVATGIHPLPFSIAPLPDGRILLTEKKLGLSIISADGEQSELIQGTPRAYDDGITTSQYLGLGWMMDVALHPDYEDNGWIYLHYGDRCSDCNASSRTSGNPVSMNALDRGRIKDGVWEDGQAIWRAHIETYTSAPDMAAGGRISFDNDGHVFISVGMKGPTHYDGIQDLSLPYGKIHRMHDDGRVPSDNPFMGTEGALGTTWSYGHRSPQGLEFNELTGQLWGTEMGPLGGDELNLLLPGKNYGWPLYSKGVNYDRTPVDYGKELGIEFELDDIVQPVVDWTPAPAVSSFIFYEGSTFPEWRHNVIVGTLKATELYRVVLEDSKAVHTETLLEDLAEIRDIETAPDGSIYLLLEHSSGGQIVRLVR